MGVFEDIVSEINQRQINNYRIISLIFEIYLRIYPNSSRE
jgi:hypothetical protein